MGSTVEQLADRLTCDEWDIAGSLAPEYANQVDRGEITFEYAVQLLQNAAEDYAA